MNQTFAIQSHLFKPHQITRLLLLDLSPYPFTTQKRSSHQKPRLLSIRSRSQSLKPTNKYLHRFSPNAPYHDAFCIVAANLANITNNDTTSGTQCESDIVSFWLVWSHFDAVTMDRPRCGTLPVKRRTAPKVTDAHLAEWTRPTRCNLLGLLHRQSRDTRSSGRARGLQMEKLWCDMDVPTNRQCLFLQKVSKC